MAVNSSTHGYVPAPGAHNAPGSYLPQAPLPQAPGFGPAAPLPTLLQDRATIVPALSTTDARLSARRQSSGEDKRTSDHDSEEADGVDQQADAEDEQLSSGKSDSESPDFSDDEAEGDHADGGQLSSGKSDSDEFSDDESVPDARRDASSSTAPLPSASSPRQPATEARADSATPGALYAGVTLLRAEDISVGTHLGSGAFGQVFRGDWKGEAVALKQIDFEHARRKLPLSETDIAEALQWEVSRLATTHHPNLVQFHGVCRKDGNTYLVLEYCAGGSLQSALKQSDIPDARLWQWMREIADALAYLHSQGMLHRDLKAENVLIDAHGRAKLADLGVAQVDALLEDAEARAVNMGLQDMAFIAPENLSNVKGGSLRQSSKATDIYALGLVFWQMVSGGLDPTRWEAVLQDASATAQMRAGQRMPIPQACPEPMRELILACWRVKPEQRADIAEVQRQLRTMGPVLNPSQAAIVELLEHLEASLHPMRSRTRDYVPTRVTEHRIEGSVEEYWAQWEGGAAIDDAPGTTASGDASVSSTSSAAPALRSSDSMTRNPPLPLQAALDAFVEQADGGTLLLLGEGGTGKSIGIAVLADRLLQQWWRHLADPANVTRPRHLPVFMRGHVSAWSEAALSGAWATLTQRFALGSDAPRPLVIVDGFDECSLQQDESMNLALRLGLPADAKLIVSCRPYVFKEEDLSERFACNGRLQIRHTLPFQIDQLLDYLRARLGWDAVTHAQYRSRLMQSRELRETLRNPFVLHLLAQSWETIGKQPLEQLTRSRVYAGFIAHLIGQGSVLLAPEVRAELQGNAADLAASYAAFAEHVALMAAKDRMTDLPAQVAQAAPSAWGRLKELVQREARQRYAEREAQLARLDEGTMKEQKRRMVLTLEDFVAMREQAAAQLVATLPLRLRGDRYDYVHKSVSEYCAAQCLIREVRDGGKKTDEWRDDEQLQELLYGIRAFDPHILLFVDELLRAEQATQHAPPASTPALDADKDAAYRMWMLLGEVGDALKGVERYADALTYQRKALAIAENSVGAEHVSTGMSCTMVSDLLLTLDRAEEALNFYLRALKINETSKGSKHTDTARACSNIAVILGALGRHEEALSYSSRALQIREEIFGTQHEDTAVSYNGMAMLYGDVGRHAEALKYFNMAAEIREKLFGPEHVKTAEYCNNLGLQLCELSRYQEALPYLTRTLRILRKVLGAEHTTIATACCNMADLLNNLGRHDEALQHITPPRSRFARTSLEPNIPKLR